MSNQALTEALPEGLPEGLTLVRDPLTMVRIDTPAARAAVTLQGAQLVEWHPAGGEPVLYLSDQSRWQPGVAIRGGVPICFPWFAGGRNHLVTASGHPDAVAELAPAHGWARTTEWRLVDASVDASGVAGLTFELSGADVADQPHAELFPVDALVRCTMRIGAELWFDLEVVAGVSLLDVETLLHTYLAVDDISQVRIRGLDGAPYWDKVAQHSAVQSGELGIEGEVDRIHDSTRAVEVVTPRRTIVVTTTGSASTVVWNPGPEKAAAMTDFGDQDYLRMVCVESGNVVNHALTIGPGESHRMTVSFRVV